MAVQKPASSDSQKDTEGSDGRKFWGALVILLLLVMGIVFAPPFARDEKISDTYHDQPKIATKEEEAENDSANPGAVLGNTTQKTTSSESFYPGYTPPTPTPAVRPAVVQAPQTQPTPTPKPEQPPIEEPPITCAPPEFTDEELELIGEYTLDEDGNPNIEIDRFTNVFSYVAISKDNCPVSWMPAEGSFAWSQDGPVEKPETPLVMVIESERDPETHMHHSNTLRFRFRVGEVSIPLHEAQFQVHVFTEGVADPETLTIKVKILTEEYELPACPEGSCPPEINSTTDLL